MPRGCKKSVKKNRLECCDIKLSDYANSSGKSFRRKPLLYNAFAFTKEARSLCNLEMSWIDGERKEANSDDDNESIIESSPVKKNSHKSGNLKRNTKSPKESEGIVYPVDLWFLLSDYIQPEDINVFAAICKTSYLVSQTYSFWINMYKRFYKQERDLPLCLKPHCIERPLCLKSSVIRALYYFYPQFKSHISSTSIEWKNLLQLICTSMWRSQSNGKWLFSFKFQSQSSYECLRKHSTGKDELSSWMQWDASYYSDPQSLLNDVNRNPEDGCKILQVMSPNFVAAPLVMGGHLADAKVSLARDMTKQKLQLTFSFASYKQRQKNVSSQGSRECGGSCETVIFDPIESVKLLNWWHPMYPVKNNLRLNQDLPKPVKLQDYI